MHDDEGFARYFTYLNLFVFMMLILVTANNILLMFVGWEGVGLCSYLLIGFWYKRDSASNAGKKAFIVNRIGDFGFLLGIFLLVSSLGSHGVWTLNFAEIQKNAHLLDGRHCHADHALLLHRRHGEIGAASPLRVAARRNGRPDAGQLPDPRGDHGHRRRLHDRAGSISSTAWRRTPCSSWHSWACSPRSLPPPSGAPSTTSRGCSPIRR